LTFFQSLTLAQAHARAAAVLVDEFGIMSEIKSGRCGHSDLRKANIAADFYAPLLPNILLCQRQASVTTALRVTKI
jgi:hypothetical protein